VTDEAGRTRLHWPALAERLRQALASIHDPLTLAQFGLDINPTAGADEVQRMKTAYLGSDAFRKQLNGGVPEMYLLSHCYQGALAFRTFTSTPGPRGHDKWHFYCAASPTVQAANEDSRARDVHELREGASACKPKYEIVLHACAYQGGRTANHYEQVTFTMKDKTVLTKVALLSQRCLLRRRTAPLALHPCQLHEIARRHHRYQQDHRGRAPGNDTADGGLRE